jgi:hypothetical protein
VILQIVPKIGGQPLQLEASQFLVLNDEGTPIAVAGEYGPRGSVRIAHAGENDFPAVLRAFGYGRHKIEVAFLDSPAAPRGARKMLIEP